MIPKDKELRYQYVVVGLCPRRVAIRGHAEVGAQGARWLLRDCEGCDRLGRLLGNCVGYDRLGRLLMYSILSIPKSTKRCQANKRNEKRKVFNSK